MEEEEAVYDFSPLHNLVSKACVAAEANPEPTLFERVGVGTDWESYWWLKCDELHQVFVVDLHLSVSCLLLHSRQLNLSYLHVH